MPRPNIIYMHSHDTGRYVSAYGHDVPTPNIRRLAGEGVLFRQCFCAAPTCSASRAALLTGQSPHSCGMIGLVNRGFQLSDYGRHLARTLKAAGYTTTLAGVQHVAPEVDMIGYDRVLEAKRHSAGSIAAAAEEFLKSAPQRPFFMSVGFVETHRGFREPGPEDDARYTLPPAPLPDAPETRRDFAAFKASARALDEGIGTVLRALADAGLEDDTLVICTTDHGIAFPRMKCNLYDGGIGVMLMMRGPEGFRGGRVADGLVSHVDVFPTLCDLLEIEPPEWLEGRSLMPLVRGEAGEVPGEVNEEIFAEVTYHAAYEPMRCVRTKRWKYIRRFGDRRRTVLPNSDDGPSKDLWLASGWGEREHSEEELYDLVFDPNEARNVAGEARLADTLNDMRGRLDRWMRRTDDPLLKGPVPAPPGACVNDPDGTSPGGPLTTVS